MKKYIFRLSLSIVLIIGIVACSVDQGDEGFLDNRNVSAFFASQSGTLFIEEGQTNTFNVNFGLTAPQPTDLSYVIEIDPSSTAIEGVDFTWDNPGVISKGKLMSAFTVTGIYDTSTLDGKEIKFNLVSVENSTVAFRKQFSLKLVRLCPLEAPFTGTYVITQTTPGYEVAGGASVFGDGVTVELVEGENKLQRVFNAKFYPDLGFANPTVPIVFELACGTVNMIGNSAASGIGCSDGNIEVGPTTGPVSMFTSNDDSVIEITFFENSASVCGDPGIQTTIRLTKQ